MQQSRRLWLKMPVLGLGAWVLTACQMRGEQTPGLQADASLQAQLRELEQAVNGRLGVAWQDTAQPQASFSYRGDERFLMLSSFKTLAAAYVLARHDVGEDNLSRRIPIRQTDLVEYSPVTEQHVGDVGMSLAELCHATLTTSDNTAANLILESFGGPAKLTQYVRSLGDGVTRHDRMEPELNQPADGAPLDTTSPMAMAQTVNTLLWGDALSAASKAQLQAWLVANTTGGKRLRAGLPSDWLVGEKTGTAPAVGGNDVGFAVPPGQAPVIMAVYLETTTATPAERDAAIAQVARLLAQARHAAG